MVCATCNDRHTILYMYDRPGSPPGNNIIGCPDCIGGRAYNAKIQTDLLQWGLTNFNTTAKSLKPRYLFIGLLGYFIGVVTGIIIAIWYYIFFIKVY